MIDKVRKYLCSEEVQQGGYVSERELANRFKVKHGTMREFLLSFEGEGLLERIPRKGYKLINYEVDDRESVDGMRYCVERLAVKKAIKTATREDILRLMLICEDMEKHSKPEEYKIYDDLERAFHTALVEASHNKLLKKLYSLLTLPFFHAIGPPAEPQYIRRTTKRHWEILEALRNRDLTAANKAIDNHIRNPFKED